METKNFDVVIVGGSYAGLAAALTLGRSLRKTLVIDSGQPCNRQTPHAHNFITQDGVPPKQIAQVAREQVRAYPTVAFAEDLVTSVNGSDGAFAVTTQTNTTYRAKKLIFATGVRDILPTIPGLAECWGITVIHCPYCHGYEVRSQRTGILVNDESALEFAQLILHWTDTLAIYTNGAPTFDVKAITNLGVQVTPQKIRAITHVKGRLSHLVFEDGSSKEIDALYYRASYEQHCSIPAELGCELTETGHLVVNDFKQTNIPGVYAVGDATTPFRAVGIAAASGTTGAAMLNHALINTTN